MPRVDYLACARCGSEYTVQRRGSSIGLEPFAPEQYELSKDQVGDAWQFLKDGMECSLMVYNNKPLTITPPNHVILKVEYCEPGAKGNTATNVTKPCKMETGAEILAPAFINIGDFLRIDTRTGEYIERAKDPNS